MLPLLDWFRRTYAVQRLGYDKGDDVRYVLGRNGRADHGLFLRATSKSGESWTAVALHEGLTGVQDAVVSTPHPDCFLVVSGGRAIWTPTEDPVHYEELDAVPVIQITKASEDLLLLSTFTEIVAFGSAGRVWQSDRVSLDGFAILTVDPEKRTLLGKGYNPHVSEGGYFRVSLDDGTVALLRDGAEISDEGVQPAESYPPPSSQHEEGSLREPAS